MSRAILKWLRPGRIYPHGDFQRVEFAETHELVISVLFFFKWTTYPITSSPYSPPASYSYRLQRSNQQPTLAHLGTCLASNQTYSARTAFSKPGERSQKERADGWNRLESQWENHIYIYIILYYIYYILYILYIYIIYHIYFIYYIYNILYYIYKYNIYIYMIYIYNIWYHIYII